MRGSEATERGDRGLHRKEICLPHTSAADLQQTSDRLAADSHHFHMQISSCRRLSAALPQTYGSLACRILFQSCLSMDIHDEESAADLSQPSCRLSAAF